MPVRPVTGDRLTSQSNGVFFEIRNNFAFTPASFFLTDVDCKRAIIQNGAVMIGHTYNIHAMPFLEL